MKSVLIRFGMTRISREVGTLTRGSCRGYGGAETMPHTNSFPTLLPWGAEGGQAPPGLGERGVLGCFWPPQAWHKSRSSSRRGVQEGAGDPHPRPPAQGGFAKVQPRGWPGQELRTWGGWMGVSVLGTGDVMKN